MTYQEKEILDLGKNIEDKIIDAYKSLREHNFHRAYNFEYSKEHSILADVIYYIMKDEIFKYRLIKERWTPGNNNSKIIDTINEKGISHNVENRYEVGYGLWYANILSLQIYEKKGKLIKLVQTEFGKRFIAFDNFFQYCANEYINDKKNIDSWFTLLANLPSEMNKAYDDWKNAKRVYSPIIQKINQKLDEYDKSVDIIELYKESPKYFLEKFNEMPKEEQEAVIKKLLRNTNFQANKEIDALISKDHGNLIAEAFRKGVGKR